MRFFRQFALVALTLATAVDVRAEDPEDKPSEPVEEKASVQDSPAFDRYRTILDRMPFGIPPPNFDPTLPPGSAAAAAAAASAAANGEMTEEQRTEEEQKLAGNVRVSVLNITPAGRTMVGFTDSSAQPPEHYYLPVGGERDGWTVKDADPAAEKITLAKGGIEVTVKLGEGPTGDGKDKKKTHPRGLEALGRRGLMARRMVDAPQGGAAPGAGGAMARLRERRAREMQEQQAEAARRAEAAAEERAEKERREAEAKQAAAQAAAEREQQRDALMQIQEELRRQREEKERLKAERQDQESESE